MKKLFFLFIFILFGKLFHAQTAVSDTTIYSFSEIMPEFPASEGTLGKYLADHIKYPTAEKEAGKQGTVYISFIVEKDGSITHVHSLKEVSNAPGLTKEAIRVISTMPKWIPGKMQGQNVRVVLAQPVKFVLLTDTKPNVCGINKTDTELGYVATANPGRVPEYIGGYDSLQKRILSLEKKLKAEQTSVNDQSVMFSFIVDTSGQVVNLVIEKNLPGEEDMVMSIAESFCTMPKWIPGGTGPLNAAGSRNANVKLYADVFLGEYQKKKVIKAPSIIIENLGTPPSPTVAKKIILMPVYFGGDSVMKVFLKTNTVYPTTVKKSKKAIVVPVTFIVENDGSLSYVEVPDDVSCDQAFKDEAVRVVSSMPKWQAGTINGKIARFPVKVEVIFQ